MQLLKNLVLHDLQGRGLLSKLERKGSEVWHAGTFDGAVGKQELLAAYLNQIEFGGREIVGLYRASRHFFRKEPKDLNLYEAALLAGMVQAPARFNPLKETTKERAHERARLVLDLMVQQGRITPAERRRAEQLGVRPGLLPPFRIQPQPFTEWVVQRWGPQFVKEGETIRFFVTLEPRFQRLAERHLAELVSEGAVPAEYEAGADDDRRWSRSGHDRRGGLVAAPVQRCCEIECAAGLDGEATAACCRVRGRQKAREPGG